MHLISYSDQVELERSCHSFLVGDFLVEDLPNHKGDIEGMSENPTIVRECTTYTSKHSLTHIKDFVNNK